jgi:NADH dehydrogenase
MAGTMSEIAQHTLAREFRRIDTQRTKVVLVEGSDRVLGAFVPELSEKARQQLQRLHVDVRLGCKVTGIDADGVSYESRDGDSVSNGARDGDAVRVHRLASKTVIWAAGVAASPLGRVLAASTGATLDRAGRVVVEPDLSLAGHPEISVIGDLAAARSFPSNRARGRGEPKPVPGVSPGAKQMGRVAAANLLRGLQSQPTVPFRYIDYGNLATIGRKAAVVDLAVPPLGSLRFSGYFAWLFWLFAHIYFLIGFRNRFIVLMDWAWAYWTYERNARVVAEPATTPRATVNS